MNPLSNNKDCEFAEYFKNLGYEYSWDFSRRDNLHWHEIYKGDELVIQIEMIALSDIIRDMCIEEDVENEYFIGCEEDQMENYKELCEKVREFEKNKKL